MRRVCRTALIVICLVSAGASRADDEADRLQLARDISIASQQSANFDKIMPVIINSIKPMLTHGDPKIEKDFDAIAPIFSDEFGKIKGQMIDNIAHLWARAFTKTELEELLSFYKTATGQKLVRTQPELSQAIVALGQQYGQQVAAAVVEKMKTELRKRGHNI